MDADSTSVEKGNLFLSRAKWALLALLCLIYIFRTNSVFQFEGGDNAHYFLLAKALAYGRGYNDVFRPGSPPHTQYPPLFPAMLAAVIAIRGNDMWLMKLTVSIGAAAVLPLVYILLRRRSFAAPFAAAIWLGCSYKYFSLSDWLLTEPVFIAFLLTALIAFDKWLKEGSKGNLILAVSSCWAAEMTRTAGITVAAAFAIVILLSKKPNIKRKIFSAGVITTICLLPALIWSARNIAVSGSPSNYVSQLIAANPYNPEGGAVDVGGLGARVFNSTRSHFLDAAGMVGANLTVFPKPVMYVVAFLLWVLISVGFTRKARRDFGVSEIFTIIYLLMIVAWPFSGYRFMAPAYPLLFGYATEGAGTIIDVFKKGVARKISKICAATLFLAAVLFNAVVSRAYWKQTNEQFDRLKFKVGDIYVVAAREEYANLLAASDWMSKNTPKEAVVMTRIPRLVALASDRLVVDCLTMPPANPAGWLLKNNVYYIVVDDIYPDTLNFVRSLANDKNEIPGAVSVFQSGGVNIISTFLFLRK